MRDVIKCIMFYFFNACNVCILNPEIFCVLFAGDNTPVTPLYLKLSRMTPNLG